MQVDVANAGALPGPDPVRETSECAHFAGVVRALLGHAPGGRVLDLGCGDGLVERVAGPRLEAYVGVDLHPAAGVRAVRADLREGLGELRRERFDLYVGTFGIASHLAPHELRDLLREIAASAAPGALVALEALGLYSLEWPRIWDTPLGSSRALSYRLTGDLTVHPWSPTELLALFEETGLSFLGAVDRTVQAAPKVGEPRGWPGVPRLRAALSALLAGDLRGGLPLSHPLPPLPAHPAAAAHHALAAARRALIGRARSLDGPSLARAVWALEPTAGRALGHGLLAVGRVRR